MFAGRRSAVVPQAAALRGDGGGDSLRLAGYGSNDTLPIPFGVSSMGDGLWECEGEEGGSEGW